MADFDAALVFDPSHTLAILNRALTLSLMGQPELGLIDADRAVSMTPDGAAAQATRAQILAVLGRSSEAVAGFETAITLGGDELVNAYQRRLIALGYDAGLVDGDYGGRTKVALEACVADACNLLQDP